jgi:hypothetical protein
MTRIDTKRPDVRLLAALAAGRSQEEAAAEVGVSKSTVTRRMRDTDFRRQLNEARSDFLDHAMGILARSVAGASQSLATLSAKAKSEQVRSSSSRAVVDLMVKLVEVRDLEARIEALEQRSNGGPGA